MKKGVVLYDRIGYREGSGDKATTEFADKGTEVELSDSEFERLSSLTPPAIGTAADLAAQATAEVQRQTTGASDLTDDQLAALSVDEATLHLQQYAADIDRIDRLEDAREPGRRTGIDRLLEKLRATPVE